MIVYLYSERQTTQRGMKMENVNMAKFHANNAKSDARYDFSKGRTCSRDWKKGNHINKLYEAAYWEEMELLTK